MTDKRKLQPGDLWLITGMLAVLGAAIWLPVLLLGQMPEYSALKGRGLTVDAVVRQKEVEATTSSRRERNNASENYYLHLAFDSSAGRPYAEALAEGGEAVTPAQPSSGADIVAGLFGNDGAGASAAGPTDTQVRLNAGTYDRFAALAVGDTVSVTYLPEEPTTARLTEHVRAFNPWPMLAVAGLLLVAGIAACVAGWKRRRTALRAFA